MPNQDIAIPRIKMHNQILDLKSKYFERIESIIVADQFQEDLIFIEKEISSKYSRY